MTLFILAQGQPDSGLGIGMILFPLLLLVVFWMFFIRPQSKRDKQRRAMIAAVKKGDRIVTLGGIHGTVLKVEENGLLVEVDQNVKLRFDRSAVASVATKD